MKSIDPDNIGHKANDNKGAGGYGQSVATEWVGGIVRKTFCLPRSRK